MPSNQPNNQYPQQEQYRMPMQQTGQQHGSWGPYQGMPSGGPVPGGSGSAVKPGSKGKNGSNKQNGKGGGNGKSKGKRPVSFWISVAIAAIAVVAVIVMAAIMLAPDQKASRNHNAIIGQIDGKSKEEIQAELDRIIEEGMFNISIASIVEFDGPDAEGELKIENVPNNHYLMNVVITRNDTGEEIYESGVLEPNYHVQTAKLDKHLDPGTYECTATFHALDRETEEEIGSAAAVMTVIMH